MSDAATAQTHVHPVRVYYEDTDAGGIVYYANYLKFAERARTELLRVDGIENAALMDSSRLAFAVKECHADYIKPARLDDFLEVRTRVVKTAGASVRLVQDVCRDGQVLVAISIRLACMDVDSGAPRRMPDNVRTVLAARETMQDLN